MIFRRGFTLIELLVVIAIIGLLAAVVLASLNSARAKARDAAVVSGMHEFRKLLELEYSETGSYAALQASWDYTPADCNNSFSGTHAANARQICSQIVSVHGAMHSGNNVSSSAKYSIMGKLSTGLYYCLGSSGAQSSNGYVNSTWTQPGCYSNP